MIGPVENIAGYKVGAQSVRACVTDIVSWIKNRKQVRKKDENCRWLACINPHSYAVALNDVVFSRALHAADWLIPDGAGVVFASKLLNGHIRERVTGSDIFQGVLEELNRTNGYSVFFLGSTDETLAAIRARMVVDYPNIRLAGTYSPPFKPVYSKEELDAMVTAINDAAPDVLWVGMTAPKQEKWIYENRTRLNVKFAGAIGAVFDFYTGQVKRSHPFFQRIGLEWLPRLIQQPRRLWRRMFVSAPIFVLHVLRQRLGIVQR
ncbi:WecB/TagA/CpsF family glycosyltransferase [Nitrosomonas sp. Nm166]|uniref:WecB/TagA/CpsF family glycosyltransferase n=1 Tax=Nitrosomonas sp. Nm166 TaxID=1881054 RepID=UPI0008EAB1F5|nr:WecB/TagA/CpsF family glycosyltransferase [Nitrosomonas sp. Nm166]SFD91701.1 N-acetylglucosaminyldiphosphoundecaprenol N-acetyl-beta-D-mannosaminyltransferase [Nitrosomonas sp. Nm166]